MISNLVEMHHNRRHHQLHAFGHQFRVLFLYIGVNVKLKFMLAHIIIRAKDAIYWNLIIRTVCGVQRHCIIEFFIHDKFELLTSRICECVKRGRVCDLHKKIIYTKKNIEKKRKEKKKTYIVALNTFFLVFRKSKVKKIKQLSRTDTLTLTHILPHAFYLQEGFVRTLENCVFAMQ